MATYVINVDIDKSWVPKFNKSKTKLCFAHGVLDSSSDDTGLSFNVVGTARDVLQNVSLTWTDEYAIAGGKQSFSAGTKIEATTDPEKIEFKQSVTLNESYLLDPAKPDPKLGEGVFAFVNKVTASVYLYKKIVNDKGASVSAPFYISKDGPNPPGHSQLTPKPVTRLFFAKHYESGTMVEDFQSEYIDIDLTNKTSAAVKYNADGHWIPSPNADAEKDVNAEKE
ncbi:hypothetical protein F5Y18DRAFT_425151 [Xylariaceae sp. FL1019]|nr:hypothetical protein F5Y18DRAFT_425151 [Xylariaceae sp. FL1019]